MSIGPTSPVQQQDIDRIEGKLDRIIKLLEMILKESKAQYSVANRPPRAIRDENED